MVDGEEDLSKIATLQELDKSIAGCQRCRLSETRTNIVFGVGNPDAELMFVGEAPGFNEDRKGEPFVGAAGKLLDELLLTIMGLTRQDVYIGNVLKCRPPENRDPTPEEIACCRPFIARQIDLINPRVICTLGNFATRLLLDRNVFISKVHGDAIALDGRWIFPTYHPAAALYAAKTKEVLIEDFKKLADLLIETGRAAESERDSESASRQDQLGLF